MTRHPFGRRLAAAALGLYALVAGLLVPLHAFVEESGPRSAPVAGVVVDADCHDRDCREPLHHHRGHAHDAATCVSCAQAKAASSAAPAFAVAAPVPLRAGAVSPALAAAPVAVGRAAHPARGPPVLS